jgi:hypothetical protein
LYFAILLRAPISFFNPGLAWYDICGNEDVDVYKKGLKYSPEKIQEVKNKAALKHETFLEDCVDAFVMLARNTSMTGMRVQVDAGLNVQGA